MSKIYTIKSAGFLNVALTILLLIPQLQLRAEDRGGYAGVFLRLGLGARAKALGGAYVANPGDGYGAYYNPAGLARLQRKEALLSYRNLSLDRSFHYVGFAAPMPPKAGMAAGWLHAGTNNIDGRDFSGNHTGTLDDSQNAVMFGFGLQLPANVQIGIGGTYIRENLLDISASGFGINLGVLYRPFDFLSFGCAVRDLNARYSWNSESLYERGSSTNDKFPAVFSVGTALRSDRYKSTVYIDVFKNSKSEAGVRLGIENEVTNNLFLRAGINDGNLTAGGGLTVPVSGVTGRFDYAVEISDIDPEAIHVISFNVQF